MQDGDGRVDKSKRGVLPEEEIAKWAKKVLRHIPPFSQFAYSTRMGQIQLPLSHKLFEPCKKSIQGSDSMPKVTKRCAPAWNKTDWRRDWFETAEWI